jgi:hypothetical protein
MTSPQEILKKLNEKQVEINRLEIHIKYQEKKLNELYISISEKQKQLKEDCNALFQYSLKIDKEDVDRLRKEIEATIIEAS